MIIYPKGYGFDLLHEADKKRNPHKHYLMQDSYSCEEALDMCCQCAELYMWNNQLYYDACTNRYYKMTAK